MRFALVPVLLGALSLGACAGDNTEQRALPGAGVVPTSSAPRPPKTTAAEHCIICAATETTGVTLSGHYFYDRARPASAE